MCDGHSSLSLSNIASERKASKSLMMAWFSRSAMAPASAIHTSSVHIELGQLVAFEHVQQGIFGDNTFVAIQTMSQTTMPKQDRAQSLLLMICELTSLRCLYKDQPDDAKIIWCELCQTRIKTNTKIALNQCCILCLSVVSYAIAFEFLTLMLQKARYL